ncbi:MAG: CPBP family intramembrane metalloprotease [Anaerolineaceae bacterium]|nr:CPBP family intramembrane metalloprotease [Anaerolineaceae bacterium]
MKNPFWNAEDRRPRAFWRMLFAAVLMIGIQILLMFLFMQLIQIISKAAVKTGVQAEISATVGIILSRIAAAGSIFVPMILAGRFFDRRKFSDYGFHLNRDWWIDFTFGFGLGAVLMLIIFVVELFFGWIHIVDVFRSEVGAIPFWFGALVMLVSYIFVGVYEEAMARGYLLRNLAEGLNPSWWSSKTAVLAAFVISSSLFSLAHLGNPNSSWVSTLNLTLAGILLGLAFVITGELALPIGLHLSWNFFQGTVFGFPVSGWNGMASAFVIDQRGPAIWTGAAFGPEAGIIGLLAMVLGSVLIVFYCRRRYGSAKIIDRLAEYQADGSLQAVSDTTGVPRPDGEHENFSDA